MSLFQKIWEILADLLVCIFSALSPIILVLHLANDFSLIELEDLVLKHFLLIFQLN